MEKHEIYKDNEIYTLAMRGAEKYLLNRGYDILDGSPYFDVVAFDNANNELVFTKVVYQFIDSDSFNFLDYELDREECELGMIDYIFSRQDIDDCRCRFDTLSISIMDTKRACIKHHVNALTIESKSIMEIIKEN